MASYFEGQEVAWPGASHVALSMNKREVCFSINIHSAKKAVLVGPGTFLVVLNITLLSSITSHDTLPASTRVEHFFCATDNPGLGGTVASSSLCFPTVPTVPVPDIKERRAHSPGHCGLLGLRSEPDRRQRLVFQQVSTQWLACPQFHPGTTTPLKSFLQSTRRRNHLVVQKS